MQNFLRMVPQSRSKSLLMGSEPVGPFSGAAEPLNHFC